MSPGAFHLSRHNLADLVQVEDHVLGTRDADTPDAELRPIALFDAKKALYERVSIGRKHSTMLPCAYAIP